MKKFLLLSIVFFNFAAAHGQTKQKLVFRDTVYKDGYKIVVFEKRRHKIQILKSYYYDACGYLIMIAKEKNKQTSIGLFYPIRKKEKYTGTLTCNKT